MARPCSSHVYQVRPTPASLRDLLAAQARRAAAAAVRRGRARPARAGRGASAGTRRARAGARRRVSMAAMGRRMPRARSCCQVALLPVSTASLVPGYGVRQGAAMSPFSPPHLPAPGRGRRARRASARCPCCSSGIFLAVLDFFVVNVALPSIDRSLHAGPALLELVVAGYGVGYACTLVAGGRLGDLHGRRAVFIVGMLAFTAASAAVRPRADRRRPRRRPRRAGRRRRPDGAAGARDHPGHVHGRARERALGLYGAVLGAAMVAGQLSAARSWS